MLSGIFCLSLNNKAAAEGQMCKFFSIICFGYIDWLLRFVITCFWIASCSWSLISSRVDISLQLTSEGTINYFIYGRHTSYCLKRVRGGFSRWQCLPQESFFFPTPNASPPPSRFSSRSLIRSSSDCLSIKTRPQAGHGAGRDRKGSPVWGRSIYITSILSEVGGCPEGKVIDKLLEYEKGVCSVPIIYGSNFYMVS